FSPEILAEMTGILSFISDEVSSDLPPVQAPPVQPGMQPPDPQVAQQQMQMAQQQRQMQVQQQTQQVFEQAIELLKNDKMRTFRIDIETNSTIALDKQAEKEAVVEMLTMLGGVLEKAAVIGQQIPE